MNSVWTIILLVNEALVLVAILLILRRPREPHSMLSWILTLLLLPFLGLFLYLILGEPRHEWHRMRRRWRQKRNRGFLRRLETARPGTGDPPIDAVNPAARDLMTMARRLDAFPASRGNHVTIYNEGELMMEALREAIRGAMSHVHLEYYIFQPDATGREILDLLIEKARTGVRCRLLLDYVGSYWLTRRLLRPFAEAGGRYDFSFALFPWRNRWRINYRNHRKIAVIDGKVGFTGSQNIGDEYLGKLAEYGAWQDTHLRVVGPAVLDLQGVFAQDWFFTTKEDLVTSENFPEPETAGDHVVQIVPSGPHQRTAVMHQLLFAAASLARSSICVITPYFVPDVSMVLAFEAARHRGVKVRLLVPSRSDATTVLWAGRSYYEEFLALGVEVYEYDRAVLHSKVIVFDRICALVGSANMDVRSFRLNFELTKVIYSGDLIDALQEDFDGLVRESRRITLEDLAKRTFFESVVLGLARLASPLL